MKKIIIKSLTYLALLGVGLYFGLHIAPQFDGRKDFKISFIHNIEKIKEKAVEHGAREFLKKDVDGLEFEIDLLKKLIFLEYSVNWFLRDFRELEKKSDQLFKTSIELLIKTASIEKDLISKCNEGFKKLEEILSKSEKIFSHTSNNITFRKRIASAKIYYETGKRLFSEKKYSASYHEISKGLIMANMGVTTGMEILSRFSDPKVISASVELKKKAINESKRIGSAIVVNKEKHILELYKNGKLYKTYTCELGANMVNRKLYAGDRATPEGYYYIVSKKGKGQSKYYMALLINYPNNEDYERFKKAKEELGKRAQIGGLIEIHGGGGQGFDWTDGCVALTDKEMEELFKYVSIGTPVAIIPTEGDGPINRAIKELK